METFWKHFEFIVKNGPGALLVLIVCSWLAADYGYLNSQSKSAAEAIKEHAKDSAQTQKVLENIVDILEEQRRVQTQAALLACLKDAKVDYERTDCVKKFSVNVIPKR